MMMVARLFMAFSLQPRPVVVVPPPPPCGWGWRGIDFDNGIERGVVLFVVYGTYYFF